MAAFRLGVFLLGMLLLTAVGAALECEGETRSDDERLTALVAPMSSDDAQVQRHERATRFARLWCDADYAEGLGEADDEAVLIRLRAVSDVALYASNDWVAERYLRALTEADRRDLADHEHYVRVQSALQALGRHDEARQVSDRFPDVDLPVVPERVAADAPQPPGARLVWRADDENDRLHGEWLDLTRPQLLVVTSIGCMFCRAALRDMIDDEHLGPLIREHSVWLNEQSIHYSYQNVVHWNRSHPQKPMVLLDDPSGWPIERFDVTPGFYFADEGELVHQMVGWISGSEAMWTMVEGFERIGLMDTADLAADVFDDYDSDEPSYAYGCPERGEAWEEIIAGTPVRTRAELDAHLDEADKDSPLAALPPEARKRLIESLDYGDDRVVGFRPDDMKLALEPEQSYRIAALFGLQYAMAGYLFSPDLLDENERRLNAMLECRVNI